MHPLAATQNRLRASSAFGNSGGEGNAGSCHPNSAVRAFAGVPGDRLEGRCGVEGGRSETAGARGRLADAMAALVAELAAQEGDEADVAAMRAAISTSLEVLNVHETATADGWGGPPPGCRITRVYAQKCGGGGGGGGNVIYQVVDAKPIRDPIAAGGGHCTPCVNGWSVCIEYICDIQRL